MCVFATACTDSNEDGSTNKQASTGQDGICLNEFVQTDEYVQKNQTIVKVIAPTSKEVKSHGLNVPVTSESSKRKHIRNRLLSFLQQITLSHEVASSPHKKTVTSVSSHNMCRGFQNDSRLEF